MHTFLGPVLQVRHLRDGFNAMCDFPFAFETNIIFETCFPSLDALGIRCKEYVILIRNKIYFIDLSTL